MIYLNTNDECIAQRCDVDSKLCEQYGVDPHHVADEAAGYVDLEPIEAAIYAAGFESICNDSFRDWNGGTIAQFHRGMGTLVAFDADEEEETAARVSDLLDAQLKEAVAAELKFFAEHQTCDNCGREGDRYRYHHRGLDEEQHLCGKCLRRAVREQW